MATASVALAASAWPLAASAARVEGRVVFEGPAPAAAKVAPRTDPACPAASVPAPMGPDGGLAGVLVRWTGAPKPGLGKPAALPKPLVIEQRGCAYVPAVAGLQRGQALEIRTADRTLHNVHAWRADETEFNLAQPAGAPPVVRTLDADAGEVLRLSCDVHPWMAAHVVVIEHASFAVTDATGAFAIDGLPPGTHTLKAWHPTLGARDLEVTVVAGKPARARVIYSTLSPSSTTSPTARLKGPKTK